jgi:hypothetical protein
MEREAIGKVFKVHHSRKGNFSMKITGIDGEWITGVIVKGRAGAMLYYNERETGETITIRECLCTFTPPPDGKVV